MAECFIYWREDNGKRDGRLVLNSQIMDNRPYVEGINAHHDTR